MVEKTSKNYMGTGRRKEAVARVFLRPGLGRTFINGKRIEEHFNRPDHQKMVKAPLKVTDSGDKVDVKIKIEGGGITGQAGASRLGIARALEKYDESLRDILKEKGFLTRDPRVKERKKYGRKRARKSFQFSKR